MRLAIFDIDGTLLSGMSTEKAFAIWLWRRRLLGARAILAFLFFLLRWVFHFRADVTKKNKAYLVGLSLEVLAEEARLFVDSEIISRLRPDVVERLRTHQEAGDIVILLSGTLDCIAEELGESLHVDRSIGSSCVLKDGRFTVKPPTRHPFAVSKREILAQLCAELSIAPGDVTAYGDSIHDSALLEAVGNPVAVYPDRKLSVAALERGWQKMGPGSFSATDPIRHSAGS
jgi:HAD superfamily hydrolase (TIGR01490 family)